MPGQPTSDAAFDLHRVCLHGIQFTYGISFDQFTPPERSSADYLARIQDCTVETATTCVEPTVTVNARDPSG